VPALNKHENQWRFQDGNEDIWKIFFALLKHAYPYQSYLNVITLYFPVNRVQISEGVKVE
jgi:hypothetical protein